MIKVFDDNGKISIEFIELLYKKLKFDLFYDKIQKTTKAELVDMNFEGDTNKFTEVANLINDVINGNLSVLDSFLAKIDINIFPKKAVAKENERKVYSNCYEKIEKYEIQLFVDMPIELHLIGIAWILICGFKLDMFIGKYSFGNRLSDIFKSNINKKISEMEFSDSHFLFQPYYQNYESWQKSAYNIAKDLLDKKEDCIITTFDITRFYYSVKINEDFKKDVYLCCYEHDDRDNNIKHYLTEAIFKIIDSYSGLVNNYNSIFPQLSLDKSLPIGFYPSSILSNFYLRKYDELMIKTIKPVYYGRYVDDFIIVEKSFEKLESNINAADFLKYYKIENNKNNDKNYHIDEGIVYNASLNINSDKTSVSYFSHNFRHDSIDEIIKYFDANEAKFNYLSDEEIDYAKDFLDIYTFGKEITKFNQLCDFEVDKFKFSVSLAQYKKYLCLIDCDKSQNKNLKELYKVLHPNVIINNYYSIEKLFDIFFLASRLNSKYIIDFFDLLLGSINSYSVYLADTNINEKARKTLKDYIISSFISSSINCGGKIVKYIIEKFCEKFSIDTKKINDLRMKFRKLNMFDKSQCSIYFPIVNNDIENVLYNLDINIDF